MELKITIDKPDLEATVRAVIKGQITHLTDWETIVAVAKYCVQNNIDVTFIRFDIRFDGDRPVRIDGQGILDSDELGIDLRG